MNSFRSILLLASASRLSSSSSVTGTVLIFGVLKPADEILTLNDEGAHWAIVLIAHPRAALLVQQVKGNVFALGRVWIRNGIATSPKDRMPVPGGGGMYLRLAEQGRAGRSGEANRTQM